MLLLILELWSNVGHTIQNLQPVRGDDAVLHEYERPSWAGCPARGGRQCIVLIFWMALDRTSGWLREGCSMQIVWAWMQTCHVCRLRSFHRDEQGRKTMHANDVTAPLCRICQSSVACVP